MFETEERYIPVIGLRKTKENLAYVAAINDEWTRKNATLYNAINIILQWYISDGGSKSDAMRDAFISEYPGCDRVTARWVSAAAYGTIGAKLNDLSNRDAVYCSRCVRIQQFKTRYCPWCGAKMSKEDEK